MQLRRTLIGVLALFGALAMPGVADATPGTTATGTLERFPQEAVDAFGPEFTGGDFWAGMTSGTLLPVPGAGQLWQVYTSLSSERTGILVRDSQSLRVLRTFELSTTLRRGGLGAFWSGEWLHATDGGRHVYVVGQPNRLLEIDTATFTVRSLGTLTLAPVDPLIRPLAEVGLTFDPYTGDLLVLYGGPPASLVANRLTVLQRIDLVTGARSTRAIRSCTGPAPGTELGSDTYSPELLLQADAVYVTCQTATLVWPDDVRGAVVRLPRTSLWAADGEESSVATGERVDAVLVDPVGGRIAVLGASSGNVTVVDAPSMTVVGTFPTGSPEQSETGAGIDRNTGRFFFQSPLGFGSVDLRSTPLAAPVVDTAAAADGQERIVVEGNRAYVLSGTWITGKSDRYTIYNVAS